MSYVMVHLAVMAEQLKAAIRKAEHGQGMVEYALIIALVSIAALIVLGLLGGQVNSVFDKVRNSLSTALA